MTNIKMSKFCKGCYYTTTNRGYWEVRSMAYNTDGESSESAWTLHVWSEKACMFDSDGYCGHYKSKAAAISWIDDDGYLLGVESDEILRSGPRT